MKQLLIAGLGGFLGTAARYSLSTWITPRTAESKFPFATFTVNLLGCLLVGAFAGLAERKGLLSPDVRLFLFTGLCGGFTTFSAFALEEFALLRRAEPGLALGYAALSVIGGVLAVWLGYQLLTSAQP